MGCVRERNIRFFDSVNLPTGELFIVKPPRWMKGDVIMIFFLSPNRALSGRRLIVERKMTPILSKSPESEFVSLPPITPDPASPYLAPPQTASAAFFIWTSKTVPVIKIAPAFGCRDQPLRSENGMWERRLR